MRGNPNAVERRRRGFRKFPDFMPNGKKGRHKPVQRRCTLLAAMLAGDRVEAMLTVGPPACRSARDEGLRLFQRISFVQDAFIMRLLPDHVAGGLLHFVDLAGRERFEGAQDSSNTVRGTSLDLDDPVYTVGHQGKGIEPDIGEYPRQVLPMRLCRPSECVGLHPPAGDSAQAGLLPMRVYGEVIETCFGFGTGFMSGFGRRGSKRAEAVRFHVCSPVAVFKYRLSEYAVDVPVGLRAGSVDAFAVDPETAAAAVFDAVIVANIVLDGGGGGSVWRG